MKQIIIKTEGEQVAVINFEDDVLPYSDLDQEEWQNQAKYFATTYAMSLSSLTEQAVKLTYELWESGACLGSGTISHSAKRD